MTIDKIIENIVLLKKLEDSLENITGNTNSVVSQSLGCAIEIMRKYQKIQKIANDKNIIGDLLRMSEIRWVLEDGND